MISLQEATPYYILFFVILILMGTGCAHTKWTERRCIDMATSENNYGDICAEQSNGYENMNGADAHYEGAMCMASTVQRCLK